MEPPRGRLEFELCFIAIFIVSIISSVIGVRPLPLPLRSTNDLEKGYY